MASIVASIAMRPVVTIRATRIGPRVERNPTPVSVGEVASKASDGAAAISVASAPGVLGFGAVLSWRLPSGPSGWTATRGPNAAGEVGIP